MEQPIVAAGLGRRYGRSNRWALANVSWEVAEGSITGLIGANGAGKSTLMRCCLGFERPDRGSVRIFGIDPRKDRTAVVASIGYVAQSAPLYRGLSISDHFDLAEAGRRSFDRALARAHTLQVGLDERQRVSTLSGGQQAQVALALALGTRTRLLMLDEPLASLDPLARRNFLTVLSSYVREHGVSVVLSSHIVTDIEQIADRLLVLANGKVALAISISDAKQRFRVIPDDGTVGHGVVGLFTRGDGTRMRLVRGGDIGEPPTVEEIVLGHLSIDPAGEPE